VSAFPNSPRLVRAGIVTMDPYTAAVQSVIALQYNPDSLSRTLQIQAVPGGQDGVRVDALRLRGPAVETFKIEAAPGQVQSLAWHPRGRRLVSIGQDRMIRLWDIVTRQEILELEEHVGVLRCVAFSADGRSLAAAGPGVVRVWQASKEMP